MIAGDEVFDKVRTDLGRPAFDEVRHLVDIFLREIRLEHAVDVELIGITNNFCKQQFFRIIGRSDVFFVVIADREVNDLVVDRRKAIEEFEFVNDFQTEIGVIFRFRVVECFVNRILAEASDIMEQPDDLCQLGVVFG